MRTFITSLAIATLLVACTDNNDTTNVMTKGVKNAPIVVDDSGVVVSDTLTGIGIGDIESQMILYVTLDPSSFAPNIIQSEVENKRSRIAKASAEVSTPYPEKLTVNIYNTNAENFPGHAYRATVSLYLGKEIIHSFSYITGKEAKKDIQVNTVDIMPHLTATPGSILTLHARAEIEFFEGTDESTLTLDTPAPDTVLNATKLSNPFTLTFK